MPVGTRSRGVCPFPSIGSVIMEGETDLANEILQGVRRGRLRPYSAAEPAPTSSRGTNTGGARA